MRVHHGHRRWHGQDQLPRPSPTPASTGRPTKSPSARTTTMPVREKPPTKSPEPGTSEDRYLDDLDALIDGRSRRSSSPDSARSGPYSAERVARRSCRHRAGPRHRSGAAMSAADDNLAWGAAFGVPPGRPGRRAQLPRFGPKQVCTVASQRGRSHPAHCCVQGTPAGDARNGLAGFRIGPRNRLPLAEPGAVQA